MHYTGIKIYRIPYFCDILSGIFLFSYMTPVQNGKYMVRELNDRGFSNTIGNSSKFIACRCKMSPINLHIFTRGGSRISHWGAPPLVGRGANLPTQVLFGENICKNERIWSCWGARTGKFST